MNNEDPDVIWICFINAVSFNLVKFIARKLMILWTGNTFLCIYNFKLSKSLEVRQPNINHFSIVQYTSVDVSLFPQVHFVLCWAKQNRKTQQCRKMCNRSFMLCTPYQIQYYLCDQMTEDKTWQVGHMGTMRNEYKVLVGKPWQRREDNIKTELRSTAWEVADTTDLTQHRKM